MSGFLDLAQGDQQVAQGPQPGEGARLPVGFAGSFEAAWDENQLFGQSVASGNASMRALSDYVDEVKQRTGHDISPDLAAPSSPDPAYAGIGDTPTAAWQRANAAVTKLKAAHPDWNIAPLSDDEIDQRAVAISRAARQQAAEVAAGEHSGSGLFLGGMAGAVTDPVNLVAAPLTGGEGGLLIQALRLGGIAAATQAANEAVGAPFREQVQPGYLTSGEPIENIATAFGQGAALHMGSAALGALWRGVKTRAWPTTVRDAGNIAESEANIQGTNVYPGVAGEAAHREALTTAIDHVTRGEPVDVARAITPEVEASQIESVGGRELTLRQDGQFGADRWFSAVDRDGNVRLTAAFTLRGERAELLKVRAADVGVFGEGTAEARNTIGPAAMRDLLRQFKSLYPQIETIVGDRVSGARHGGEYNETGRATPVSVPLTFEAARSRTATAAEAAQTARAAVTGEPAPQLPFEATAAEARAQEAAVPLQDAIRAVAARGGHVLEPAEIAALADRFAKMAPDEVPDAVRDLQVAPHQMAEAPIRGRPPLSLRAQAAAADAAGDYREASRLHEQEVARGLPGARSRGMSRFELPITRGGDEIGYIKFDMDNDAVNVDFPFIESEFQGQGRGIAAYQKLVDWALSTGREFHSGRSVSASAVRIYDALGRRGYEVVASPDAAVAHTGARSVDTGAAFRVVGGPRSSVIAPAAAPLMRSERSALQTKLDDLDAQAREWKWRIEHQNPNNDLYRQRLAEVVGEADRIRRSLADEPVPLAAKEPAEVLGSPDHEAALRADLDRARMLGDVKVPAGIDEKGEPVYRSLDSALDEVDGYKSAADQIQACAAPQPAEMEPA